MNLGGDCGRLLAAHLEAGGKREGILESGRSTEPGRRKKRVGRVTALYHSAFIRNPLWLGVTEAQLPVSGLIFGRRFDHLMDNGCPSLHIPERSFGIYDTIPILDSLIFVPVRQTPAEFGW